MPTTAVSPRMQVRPEPYEPARLSVIIASVNGWALLERTLAALDAEPERDDIEIVVVERTGEATRARLRERDPKVTVVSVDEPLSIPKLRYLGIAYTTGSVVAFLEDHVEVARGWSATILELHQEGHPAVVGGAVENGLQGLVNTAAFFCEYTRYMPPVAEGPYSDLPGNNIAYRREDLLKYSDLLESGKWESWINDRLSAEGLKLVSTNRAVVRHIKPFGFRHFVAQRFHFCKSYAGMRRANQSIGRRLVYTIGSLVLPPVLLARVLAEVLRKRRFSVRFVAALPLVAFFLTVGALGEMIGYLAGPGTSLERVE